VGARRGITPRQCWFPTGAIAPVRTRSSVGGRSVPAVQPPVAKREPFVREVQGDRVVDEWHWLKNVDDPDTVAYLQAENAYTETMTERLQPLRDTLYEEIKARVQETDLSVPVKRGPWWYVSRTEEGKQYPIFCRRPGPDDE